MPLPPPPARHFDPAKLDGEMETQVADLGTYGEKAISNASDAASEVKDRLGIARSSLDSGEKLSPFGVGKQSDSFDQKNSFAASPSANSKSMGSSSKDNSFGADNKFDLNISKIRSSVDEAVGAAQGKLTSGQEDFAAAMASTKSSYEQTKSAAQDTLTKTKDSLKIGADTMRNQFGATMDSASSQFNQAKDGFQASAKDRIADMSKSANEVINQPFPQFGGGPTNNAADKGISDLQSEIAEGRRQIEALRQQVAVANQQKAASGTNSLQPMTPNAANPVFNQSGAGALQPMARQPMANNNLNNSLPPMSNNTVAKPGNLSPLGRVASNTPMNTPSGSFSPGGALSRLQPIAGSGSFKTPGGANAASNPSTAVGNNSLAPMSNQNASTVYGSLSPNAAPSQGSGAKSAYPSTPHNGFSGQKTQSEGNSNFSMPQSSSTIANPTSPIAPVGFVPNGNGGNSVTHAGALIPMGSSGVSSASRIDSHASHPGGVSSVSDVDLPAALLQGNGSYAPGSVNSLKR